MITTSYRARGPKKGGNRKPRKGTTAEGTDACCFLLDWEEIERYFVYCAALGAVQREGSRKLRIGVVRQVTELSGLGTVRDSRMGNTLGRLGGWM